MPLFPAFFMAELRRFCRGQFRHGQGSPYPHLGDSQSMPHRLVADAQSGGPFGHGEVLTFEFDEHIVRPVNHLLAFRGPSHVSGLVVAIVVDAIKAQPVTAATDIRQEVQKLVERWRYGYSSTSIMTVLKVLRVAASCLHAGPHGILWHMCETRLSNASRITQLSTC